MSEGPLSGRRVIELAGIGPGPFAAMLLADLGADVLRIDRPGGTDLLGLPHDVLNRNRRSVALDLKTADARDAVLDLVERADVLIEGFRPGVAERMGLGPADCAARNPRLVYGRMTGWGQHGPLAERAGHDIDYVALSGALHAIGPAGKAPVVPLNLVGDFGGGGMLLALGVVSAVLCADGTGVGQVVDAAMIDGSAQLMSMCHGLMAAGLWSTERGTNLLDGGAPFYDVYETSDSRHMAVGALEPRFFAQLIEGLGLDAGAMPDQFDRARWPEMRARIAEAMKGRTRDEWADHFAQVDACVAPVLSTEEAAVHPHNVARATFIRVDGVQQAAPAPRFSQTPTSVRRSPPAVGEHTREGLRDWGFSDVQITSLIATGAAHQSHSRG